MLDWTSFFKDNSKTILDAYNKVDFDNSYPKKDDIFKLFRTVEYKDIKVLILALDPYINENQANGIAFSVNRGEKVPPSLQNIFKNLKKFVKDFEIPNSGDLTQWCEQGVFLLNTALTVEKGKSGSHLKLWEKFTDIILKHISKKKDIVYMFWGNNAQSYSKYFNSKDNLILKTSHPSPLSCSKGFSDSNHFNECNNYLKSKNIKEIDWKLK